MTLNENPWVELFRQPECKSTDNIVLYFQKQAEMLMSASGGKINGIFDSTDEINKSISFALDLTSNISETLLSVAKASAVRSAPKVDLIDAGHMYKKRDYSFEIRSDRYRFRLLTLVFGPLNPVVMNVDRGVCDDLTKIDDRFIFDESEPCEIVIENDVDLDAVFRLLLCSDKLGYICSRLMSE